MARDIDTDAAMAALRFALLRNEKELVEEIFNYTDRPVLLEELKKMPFGSVWDYYCLSRQVPVGRSRLAAVKQYEAKTLTTRN